MNNIFLDFDGTIIDVWKRYYKIFCDFYKIDIDFELYKNEKRKYKSDFLLTEKYANIALFNEYKIYKKNNLENIDFLKLDTVILYNNDISNFKILTFRNNYNNLLLQIDYLDLKINLNNIICLDPKITTKKKYLMSFNDVIIVGDSESEYECSENENTTVFLVKTGLRDISTFNVKDNVFLLNDINQFINLLKNNQITNKQLNDI
ncbi:MAG: hypothetical protein FWB86_01320 [Treponema sp.]|nr:hypothetical protein [Treponema sp.]MCL2250375.1 hypothetical protein [Treponema sp.]